MRCLNVLLNLRRATMCLTFAVAQDGAEVATDEGPNPVLEAFVDNDAFQCGFCTLGQVCFCAKRLRPRALTVHPALLACHGFRWRPLAGPPPKAVAHYLTAVDRDQDPCALGSQPPSFLGQRNGPLLRVVLDTKVAEGVFPHLGSML